MQVWKRTSRVAAFAAATLVLGLAFEASAEDTSSVEDILNVLSEKGLIDDAQRTKILTKHNTSEQDTLPPVASALLNGWDFSGDLRLRHEDFWFNRDKTGFSETSRHRLRYRARFKAKKDINDWLGIGFRFVSGEADPRSTNQTLGRSIDFDTDDFRFDQAWMAFKPNVGDGRKLTIEGGKVANPFYWKVGKDFMVWDYDITLEGGSLKFSQALGERGKLFANTGYYVADENTSSSDPKVIALQGGGIFDIADSVEVGGRLSYYIWSALDPAFIARSLGSGNTPGAFDGGSDCLALIRAHCTANIGTVSAYAKLSASERWPVTIWGQFGKNFDASNSVFVLAPPLAGAVTTSKQDQAYIAGIEVGDKKQLAKFGLLYGHVEANALIAQFTDSDFLDGFTNRKGWAVYGSRQLAPSLDLNLTLFRSSQIKSTGAYEGCSVIAATNCGPFSGSIPDAKRWRLQTDLVIKFD